MNDKDSPIDFKTRFLLTVLATLAVALVTNYSAKQDSTTKAQQLQATPVVQTAAR